MFNHSSQHQNVGWERDVTNKLIVYKTLRTVEVGEELCISYGDRLWFEDADAGAEFVRYTDLTAWHYISSTYGLSRRLRDADA